MVSQIFNPPLCFILLHSFLSRNSFCRQLSQQFEVRVSLAFALAMACQHVRQTRVRGVDMAGQYIEVAHPHYFQPGTTKL